VITPLPRDSTLSAALRRLVCLLACVLLALWAPAALGQSGPDDPVIAVPAGGDGGPSVTPAPDPAPDPAPSPDPGSSSGNGGDSQSGNGAGAGSGGGSNPAPPPSQASSSGSSSGSSPPSSAEAEKPEKPQSDAKAEKQKKTQKKTKKGNETAEHVESRPAVVETSPTAPLPSAAALPFAGGAVEIERLEAPVADTGEAQPAPTLAVAVASIETSSDPPLGGVTIPLFAVLLLLALGAFALAGLSWIRLGSRNAGALADLSADRQLELVLLGCAILTIAVLGFIFLSG
jgi:hypothetical protein